MATDTHAPNVAAEQFAASHLSECARELLEWPKVPLPLDGHVHSLTRILRDTEGTDAFRLAIEMVNRLTREAVVSTSPRLSPQAPNSPDSKGNEMSDSAIDGVLDAEHLALKPEYRKVLEAAVTEAAVDFYLQGEPDALRQHLADGFAGITSLSDIGLLDYAIDSLDMRSLDGVHFSSLALEMERSAKGSEHEYRVTWEIDVAATSLVQAARCARDLVRGQASTANVFFARNMAVPEEALQVDLQQLDEERDVAACREEHAPAELG